MAHRRATCGERSVIKGTKVTIILVVSYSHLRDVEVMSDRIDDEVGERGGGSNSSDMVVKTWSNILEGLDGATA